MSSNSSWDVDKYRDSHESEEHWLLRKAFMERWKDNYSEERLVCLARVFSNIEFMGCRYPNEVMIEVSRLSKEVAEKYRKIKKTKLQRTFVSASDAAEDRAKGIKREGGLIVDKPLKKSAKINFVPQESIQSQNNTENNQNNVEITTNDDENIETIDKNTKRCNKYLKELSDIKCVDVSRFNDHMFETVFGRFVLLVNTNSTKMTNVHSSCQACKLKATYDFEDNILIMRINNQFVAQATGLSKAAARQAIEETVWNRLKNQCISVLIKDKEVNESEKISMNEVVSKKEDFGTKIESSVAVKMMKLMGWKGGGLGADAQGIEEPLQPHLQMVKRSGLGSAPDIRYIRAAGFKLMRRYMASDTFDVDLVFTNEFSKQERAVLHKCAQNLGLNSKSYGKNDERCLVVKKKLNAFSLVQAIIDKGGSTSRYRVFIPAALAS